MSNEIVEKSQVVREITLNIPGADVKKIADEMISHARQTMSVPGFRKGKVPASVIRQRAGAAIDKDARNQAIQNAAQEAVKSIENVLYTGMVKIINMNTEDGGIVAQMEVEVPPTLEIGNYKDLEVRVASACVTDEKVEKELENRRQRSAVFEPIEDRKVVEAGDYVNVKYSDVNEVAVEHICREGHSRVNTADEGDHADWSKQLIGAEVGAVVEMKKMIDDKEASAKAEIIDLKRRVVPELNDDFARDNDAENLDELRGKIRKELDESEKQRYDDDLEMAVMQQLRDANPVEIPENYVRERAAYAMKLKMEQMLHQQFDDRMIDYFQKNMPENELKEYREDYHNEIILNAIVKAENIEVTKDDIKEDIKKWLPEMEDSQVQQWLRTPVAAKYAEDQVKRDRALKVITESAKVLEPEVAAE